MTKTAPKRRRPEARPDEILDAALTVFDRKGFAAARVDDIARRAGLSKGAVYLYFPSKDAMLHALIERSAGALARAGEALVAEGGARDAEAAYRAVLTLILTALNDPTVSAAPRLVLAEAPRFPELARFYREHVIEVGQRALRSLLAQGNHQGAFRNVDPDAALRAFMGPVLAHLMLTTVFHRPGDEAKNPADMADAIADIVLYGLKPRDGVPS
tara:strand:- start:357 stop:998 length:642 start_codon:yes stop_codon:yes gene_type:complete